MATGWNDADVRWSMKPRNVAMIELSREVLHALLQLPEDMVIETAWYGPSADVISIKIAAPYLPLKAEGAPCETISLKRAQAGVAGAIADKLIDQ